MENILRFKNLLCSLKDVLSAKLKLRAKFQVLEAALKDLRLSGLF
jgi:hypothetical protein